MTTPHDDPRLRKPWMLMRLVALAVVGTSIIHLVGCLVVANFLPWEGGYTGFVFPDGAEPPELFGLLRIALMGVSLPLVATAFFMRGVVKRRTSPLPARGPVPLPDTAEGKALTRLMQATLVSMAVAEAPGIFGLAMFIIMGNFAWLGGFLAISIVAKIALFPRWSEVEEMVERKRLEKNL